jgi:hypothetical protein
MQKMLSTYKREIERLKTENREVRARGSVAERGYRKKTQQWGWWCGVVVVVGWWWLIVGWLFVG